MAKVFEQLENNNKFCEDSTKYLRKAHFSIGNENKINYQSSNQSAYKQPHNHKFLDPKDTRNSNPRKAHFELGTDNMKVLYNSASHLQFAQPKNIQQVQLPEDIKSYLTNAHFTVGYFDNSKEITEHQRMFQEKDTQKQIKAGQNARKNNYEFGDRSKLYYKTTYDAELNQNRSLGSLGMSKKQLEDQILTIKKTNIVIGNQAQHYNSETKAEYYDKTTKRTEEDEGHKIKNANLGNFVVDFKTQSQLNFEGEFVHVDRDFAKEKIKDFRQSHFPIGVQERDLESEMQGKFAEKDKVPQPQFDKSRLFRSSIKFGNLQTKYKSDYTQQFQERQRIPNPACRNERTDRASNLVVGSLVVPEQFISENRKNYYKMNTEPCHNFKNEIKKVNYELGQTKTGYQTQEKSQYSRTGQFFNSCLNDKQIDELKKRHFNYGNQHNDWQTTKIQDNQYGAGRPGKLDDEVSKNLRTHHFHFGQEKNKYDTHMNAIYTDWTKE